MALKEILSELYSNVGSCITGHPNKGAAPSRLPSVWSKDVVNQVSRQSREDELFLRQQSGVRNDEMPADAEAARISDYGDIRGGDDNEMRGYDGQADGPQDDMYADEFEETEFEDCPDCEGSGHDETSDYCGTCGGEGRLKITNARDDEDPSMKAVQALRNQSRDEEQEEPEQGPVGADLEKAPSDEVKDDQVSDDEIDDQYGTSDPDGENEFSDDVEQEWDDPNLQGVIRTVPNAHLIYKRQQEDGTFNELWQYNIGDDFRKELEVRRAILAGTDVPPNKMSSPDNTQSFELWTAGNAQVMHIRGLPN